MKKASWIFPVLMLLVAAENLYWDTCYGHFPKAAYVVMALLLLASIVLGIRLRKTGERRFLVLLIVVFVLYLLSAIFRDYIQECYYDLCRKIYVEIPGGCWPEPMVTDWK